MTVAANLQVSIGQYSDAGQKSQNQDSMAARCPDGVALSMKGVALAIADGISSSKVSHIAAETAVKSLLNDYYSTPDVWTVKASASRVIQATNSWLYAQTRRANSNDINEGFVCTLSAVILKGCQAHIFHVGDSRIARIADGVLEVLTSDHEVVLSAQERYLGRALGMKPAVEIDYLRTPISVGDILLLTTDGVHDFIGPNQILETMQSTDFENAAEAIAAAALAAGSRDNLTVQLARVEALAGDTPPLSEAAAGLPIKSKPTVGEMVDGLRIVRCLHETDRSSIYLAQTAEGEPVAMKVPATESRDSSDYMQRFGFEDWVAKRIDSPHVIKAGAIDTKRTSQYVVTEYLEGQTLRQWLTDQPKPDLDAVRNIADQIVRGLRALHRREMLHQDLRPENLMIDKLGTVKIIDLGSVAVAGIEEFSPGTLGRLPGTLQYTAPEYLSGETVSWRSDQFALGVIIYEMLTGQLPYGTRVAQIRSRRDQQQLRYKSASDFNADIPGWVDFALSRATHRDPLRRYDALSEFIVDLTRPNPEYKPAAQQPLMERNPVGFWQAVSAVLAAVAIYLFVLLQQGP